MPDTLHTLSQLPEIIFGIRLVYKKNSSIIHYLAYSVLLSVILLEQVLSPFHR